MVRTINLRFNDGIFIQLQNNKKELGVKKKTSLSWEEYFMQISKQFK